MGIILKPFFQYKKGAVSRQNGVRNYLSINVAVRGKSSLIIVINVRETLLLIQIGKLRNLSSVKMTRSNLPKAFGILSNLFSQIKSIFLEKEFSSLKVEVFYPKIGILPKLLMIIITLLLTDWTFHVGTLLQVKALIVSTPP